MNDKVKAFLLQVTIAALESVREEERPGSSRETRLARASSRVAVLVDEYRREGWPRPDLDLADRLVDEFNGMLRALPPASAGNDQTMLHAGLAAYESVRAAESGFRRGRLDKGIDRLLELLEPWDVDALPVARVVAVGRLGDQFVARSLMTFV